MKKVSSLLLVLILVGVIFPYSPIAVAVSSFGYTPIETVKTYDSSITSELIIVGGTYTYVTPFGDYALNLNGFTYGDKVDDMLWSVLAYTGSGWEAITQKGFYQLERLNATNFRLSYNLLRSSQVIGTMSFEFTTEELIKPKLEATFDKGLSWGTQGLQDFRIVWSLSINEDWQYFSNGTSITDLQANLGNHTRIRLTNSTTSNTFLVIETSDFGEAEYIVDYGEIHVLFPINVAEVDPISYTEIEVSTFSASSDQVWVEYDLYTNNAVPKGAVAEIVIRNSMETIEQEGGVREKGSSLERKVDLHEAEGGGYTTATMFVQTDATDGKIEVYAEFKINVDFVLMGYYEGCDFTEKFSAMGNTPVIWTDLDLSGEGVPANAVVQMMMRNSDDDDTAFMGVRADGSGLERGVVLDEAEGFGWATLSFIVKANAGSVIEWKGVWLGLGTARGYLLGWFGPNVDFNEGWNQYTFTGSKDDGVWQSKTISEADASSITAWAMVHQDSGIEIYCGLREEGSTLERRILEHEAEGGGGTGFQASVILDESKKCQIYCGDASESLFYYTGFFSEIAGGENYYAYPAQTMTITGTAYRLCTLSRIGEQSLTMVTNSERTWSLIRTLTQGITFTCSALGDITKIFNRFVSMTFSVTSNSIREWSLSRSLIQSFSLISNTEKTISLTRITEQLLMFSTESYRSWTLTRALNQDLSFISNIFKTFDAERALSQSVTMVSNAYRTVDLTKLVNQSMTLSVESLRNLSLIRVASQTMSLTFNAIADLMQVVLREVSLALNLSSNSERGYSGIRALSQTVSLTLNSYRSWVLTRILTQPISTAFNSERVFTVVRTLSQSILTDFNAFRIFSPLRVVSQTINVNMNAERLGTFVRALSQSLAMTLDTWIKYVEGYEPPDPKDFVRKASVTFSLGLETLRNWNLTRIAEKTISFQSEVAAAFGEVKLRVVNLLITFLAEGNVLFTTINTINLSLLFFQLTALVFTVLLLYPRITRKESDPNPILAIIAMIAWFLVAATTLHDNPDTWPQALFYGGLGITCAYDVIQGLIGTIDEEDSWALGR